MWAKTGSGRDGERREKEKEEQGVVQGAEGTDGDRQRGLCQSENRADGCSRLGHRLVGGGHIRASKLKLHSPESLNGQAVRGGKN